MITALWIVLGVAAVGFMLGVAIVGGILLFRVLMYPFEVLWWMVQGTWLWIKDGRSWYVRRKGERTGWLEIEGKPSPAAYLEYWRSRLGEIPPKAK